MGKRDGKTEAPTHKKRHDARKKGTVSKSADLGPWITLLVGTYVLPMTVAAVGAASVSSFTSLRSMAAQPDAERVAEYLGSSMQAALLATLPFLAICMAVGIVAHLLQTGLVLSWHPLKPDFKRVNPLQGVKRLLSIRSVWETAKQVAKSAVITWVCWPYVRAIGDQLTKRGRVPLLQGISRSAQSLVGMARATCFAIIAIAMVDFVYQRRTKILDLRMTKREVRDEAKNSEGDPQTKGRIRSMQAALSRSRMMDSIPMASVIVTNPTHVAIAIRYDSSLGGAPTVVAAGVGSMAGRIRERAIESGVPIVEARPLARALWRSCDIGDEVPVVLYEAVAKVLAFVRRVRGGILAATAVSLPRQYRVDDQWLEDLPGRRGLQRRRLS